MFVNMALRFRAALTNIGLIFLLASAQAIDVPGVSTPPLPGAELGSVDALVRTYHGVFTPELLEQLIKEAPLLDKVGSDRTLRNSKRQTFWLPVGAGAPRPRFAIEHAVNLLFELIHESNYEESSDSQMRKRRKQIVGGKYWVQHRGVDEDVGFHYDKDEGLASDHMIMRFPRFATVTYLTDSGAPTVIFNQTVTQNGNVEVPRVPTNTFLVYPETNKHMINRGDLNHGAIQSLSSRQLKPGEYRTTFVISWEVSKPLEPNCHYLTDDELPKSLIRKSPFPSTWQLSDSRYRGEINSITASKSDRKQKIIMGRENHFLEGRFPKPSGLDELGGTYLLEWDKDDVNVQ